MWGRRRQDDPSSRLSVAGSGTWISRASLCSTAWGHSVDLFPDASLEVVLALYFEESVAKTAKAGALFIIAEYVGISAKDKVSEALLLAIELACSLAVCDEDAFVRGAAVTVGEQLGKIPATLSLQSTGDDAVPEISPTDLAYFGATIAALSTTVIIDDAAAFAAFSAKIMGPFCGTEPATRPGKTKDKPLNLPSVYRPRFYI